MKLFDYIDKEEFDQCISNGDIFEQVHPIHNNIKIICYSKSCQMNKRWSDTTMKCRGLVYDSNTMEILAIPFKKFFNYEEFPEEEINGIIGSLLKDNHNYKIYNKLDGSLGILYRINGEPFICTKGSFSSEQANHANYILKTKYSNIIKNLDPNITYLFEIIYPEDVHCISYKGVDDIILIGAINRQTGEDIDIYTIPYFPKTICFDDIYEWQSIRDLIDGNNMEGFVVRYDNGFRFKLKYERYWLLHYLKAGLSKNKILSALIEGNDSIIHESISKFDEEHKIYYNKIISDIQNKYNTIYNICIYEYAEFDDIKEGAEYYKKCTYPAIMFAMRDNRNDIVRSRIFKIIKENEKQSN